MSSQELPSELCRECGTAVLLATHDPQGEGLPSPR
jgi:hypothetical protein